MGLENELNEVIQNFQDETSEDRLKKLEEVHNLFEKMVENGLVERPKYDLAPISTLNLNFAVSYEKN